MPDRRQARLKRGLQGGLVYSELLKGYVGNSFLGGGDQGCWRSLRSWGGWAGAALCSRPKSVTLGLVYELPPDIAEGQRELVYSGGDAKPTAAVVAQMLVQTVRCLPDTPGCTVRINKLPQILSSH